MSLLRDGVHRRALLTARFGVAKFGAARFGWLPGQNDLTLHTREIKDNPALTGTGPRYVWSERYRNEAPFSGLVVYAPYDGLGHLQFTADSDITKVDSASIYFTGDSTVTYSAGASDANLLFTAEGLVYGVSDGGALTFDSSTSGHTFLP
jgi:hypothetical protein